MSDDFQCVDCESWNVEVIEEVEAERPNGERMERLKCTDCGLEWIE